MQIKTVFVFGNPELKMDSLPLKILPELRRRYPFICFEAKDPNEEWDVPKELTIIDTVVGLKKVMVFDDLDVFDSTPRLSMHDFDALANLKYLRKLGKLKKITVIGVPPNLNEKETIDSISKILCDD